jgi:hypothetical protein
VAAIERWFLARGLPHFIDGYSASRDVFTRALPLLTLLLLLELIGALNFSWPWWLNALVAAASFAGLLAVWALTNRMRGRPLFARPDRVGATELGLFVLVPAVLPLLAGGQKLTALNTLVGNCMLLGVIYLGTSYGVVPMTRWAANRLWAQLGALLGLMVRALPLLLLFVVFLFLTPELWQVAASLNGPFLALAVGLFVALGVAFVVARIPQEVGALARFADAAECQALVAGTPAAALAASLGDGLVEPAPLGRRQWGNVGLVLLFSQGVQVLFVSLMIGVFLVAFGLIAVAPDTATAWVGRDVHRLVHGELWGRGVALTAELLQVATLLAAVAGFSFTLSLLTDRAYRQEFLDEVVQEIRQAFAVRAVYLHAVGSSNG